MSVFFALLGSSAQAKRQGLGPFAGSYSGGGSATSGESTLKFKGVTLTFTGRDKDLSGTFLYAGTLNQSGMAVTVNQVFDLSGRGGISGRVNVGDRQGLGAGKVSLAGKTLKFSLTYRLGGTGPSSISLVGTVVFVGRAARMTAKVTSSDNSFDGKLDVKGYR